MTTQDAKQFIDAILGMMTYDPKSGEFFWKHDRKKGQVKAGSLVGSTDAHGYRITHVFGRMIKIHRLVWLIEFGEWPSAEIDHINGVKSDNRIENLRDASRITNAQNIGKPNSNSTSGFRGVSFQKQRGKWGARIRIGKTYKHLGLFETPELAYQRYMEAKLQHHEGFVL